MTERKGQQNLEWERLFPDQEIRRRSQSFVDGLGLIRGVSEIILVVFDNQAEEWRRRFYVICNEEMSGLELQSVYKLWNDSFSDSRVKAAHLPIQFLMSEQDFLETCGLSTALQQAEMVTVWNNPKDETLLPSVYDD